MSFKRPEMSKHNENSIGISSLSTLTKLPSRLQSPKVSVDDNSSRTKMKLSQTATDTTYFSNENKNDVDEIINNLSTIVKISDETITPIKSTHGIATVRRTASLSTTKLEVDRRKSANITVKPISSQNKYIGKTLDHSYGLHDSISDKSSQCGSSIYSIPRRTSIRPSINTEMYSGIKCVLPTFTSTIPNAFKGFERRTPVKTKQLLIDSQVIPANTNDREKSPWRLRFEKIVNHEQVTPLSLSTEPSICTKVKISSFNKENRTPSFRPSSRRMSRLNLPQ